ncbi:hypothetical protein AX14_005479 [Amanita brunnescens Koide BX004]|nr:hypothetical protein AX14_005479 [Amanita brunnescens Koide BX004]
MYSKLAILALVAPLACATISIQPPVNAASNSPITITWTSNAPGTDPPVFSIELVNLVFHNSFAIANNVQTTQGSLTLTIPTVPVGDGYSIEFVNISNINDIFAQTGQFSVAPASSVTRASSTGTAASGSSAGSVSVTATGVPSTSSGFGTTSSTTTATSSSFNGAVSRSSNSYTVLALSAFAGVALLAL